MSHRLFRLYIYPSNLVGKDSRYIKTNRKGMQGMEGQGDFHHTGSILFYIIIYITAKLYKSKMNLRGVSTQFLEYIATINLVINYYYY